MKYATCVVLLMLSASLAWAQVIKTYSWEGSVTVNPVQGQNITEAELSFPPGTPNCYVNATLAGTFYQRSQHSGTDYELLRGFVWLSPGTGGGRSCDIYLEEYTYRNHTNPLPYTATAVCQQSGVDLSQAGWQTFPKLHVEDAGVASGAIFWDVGNYRISATNASGTPH